MDSSDNVVLVQLDSPSRDSGATAALQGQATESPLRRANAQFLQQDEEGNITMAEAKTPLRERTGWFANAREAFGQLKKVTPRMLFLRVKA